jgi:hypothetical protein
VWSYGGGTQSVAIAVLVAQGKLPKPAVTVIADTGREASETWEYTEFYVAPLLAAIGITIEIAAHDLATVDLYGKNGDLLLPVFTDGGKMPTLCSTEWKKRVVRRFLAAKGYGPKRPYRLWLGISVDEVGRAKDSDVGYVKHHYPLLFDVPLRRDDCARIVREAGLPTPPKSSCWMCPHRQNAQWVKLRDEYPEDFAKAVELDDVMRVRHPGTFLHRSSQPLRSADLTVPDRAPLPLFGDTTGECDSGYCFV